MRHWIISSSLRHFLHDGLIKRSCWRASIQTLYTPPCLNQLSSHVTHSCYARSVRSRYKSSCKRSKKQTSRLSPCNGSLCMSSSFDADVPAELRSRHAWQQVLRIDLYRRADESTLVLQRLVVACSLLLFSMVRVCKLIVSGATALATPDDVI